MFSKIKFILLVILPACYSLSAYDSITVDPSTGKPSPTGVAIDRMFFFSDERPHKLTPEVLEYIKWEMSKQALKKYYKLASLALSPYSMYQNILMTRPAFLDSIAPAIVLGHLEGLQYSTDFVNMLCKMGPVGERYAEIFQPSNPFKKVTSLDQEYQNVLLNFKENKIKGRNTVYNLILQAGTAARAVKDIVALDAVNRNNYRDFLWLMKYAGYPEDGWDTLIRLRHQYINDGNIPAAAVFRQGEVIVAATHIPKLAVLIIPEMKNITTSVSSEWICNSWSAYGLYWCKLFGINDPAYFDKKLSAVDKRKYALAWARITGDGDRAFAYAMKYIGNMTPAGMFDLLDIECQLSRKNISLIMEDYFLLQRGFMLGRFNGKPAFTPECYPVIDQMLKRYWGGNNDSIYYMMFNAKPPATSDVKAEFKVSSRGLTATVNLKSPSKWSELVQKWDFRGFLFSESKRKCFFDVLWDHQNNAKAHDLLMAGGPLIIPMLLKKISDDKPYTSIQACDFIARMGTYARKDATGPLLDKLKKSKNYIVRGAIVRTLGEIKAEDALPELKRLAENDKSKLVKINAQQTLMLFKKITVQDVKDAIEKKYGRRR